MSLCAVWRQRDVAMIFMGMIWIECGMGTVWMIWLWFGICLGRIGYPLVISE